MTLCKKTRSNQCLFPVFIVGSRKETKSLKQRKQKHYSKEKLEKLQHTITNTNTRRTTVSTFSSSLTHILHDGFCCFSCGFSLLPANTFSCFSQSTESFCKSDSICEFVFPT